MARRHGPGALKRQLSKKVPDHQNKYADKVGKTKKYQQKLNELVEKHNG